MDVLMWFLIAACGLLAVWLVVSILFAAWVLSAVARGMFEGGMFEEEYLGDIRPEP